jgi:hypothetical protein
MQANIQMHDQENEFTIEIMDKTSPVYFSDLLTNKYGNYIVQTTFDKCN